MIVNQYTPSRYKIGLQTELPSIYGDSRLTFRPKDHVKVYRNCDEYNRVIMEAIVREVRLGLKRETSAHTHD